MADPMRIRAVAKDGEVIVKVLMSHEMETGQRKDSAGKPIPAHYHQQGQRDLSGQGGIVGPLGHGDIEEPVSRIQLQGREKGREGPGDLERQQGRNPHRRGHDQLTGRLAEHEGTCPLAL